MFSILEKCFNYKFVFNYLKKMDFDEKIFVILMIVGLAISFYMTSIINFSLRNYGASI
ncbi:hypothetical protein DCCM_3067 [Desulfocucumis palustris]|uniref:Uncharacterized protein n=1 Tax=Desulfocucumis palustris TaxID=1898651 RepID=A0A2L2XI88_9FIRM|nr:hypothetical protein [Desulfocucumis palustris]GBF33956.1 hypothetical protein DCCM_3067 [Desulfocucumis palustris]